MPEYTYRCTKKKCSKSFDISHSIKDKPLSICPSCGKESLERVIYGGCHVSVSPGVTTVGKLAEVNSKKLGKYGLQEKERKEAERIGSSDISEPMKQAIINNGGKIISKEDKAKAKKDKAWYWGKENKDDKIKKINKMTPEQKERYIMQGD